MAESEENIETSDLNLEEVVEANPDELSDDQKSFLEENKENLTPEQAEKFGITLEEKDPEIPDPETRIKNEKDEKDGDEEDDEDIDEDDEKAISKVVDKRMKPVSKALEKIQALEDEKEVDSFLRSKPEFSKYRSGILKYINHSAYKNIPVHNIAAIVAQNDLVKLGAQKEREAQRKTKETTGNGNTSRKVTGKVDWGKATPQEYAAKRAEVMGHQG